MADIPACPGEHCSKKSDRINATCKAQGHSGDRVYILLADDSECWCKCSCLAWNTPIAVDGNRWRRIQDIAIGESVLTAQADKTWKSKKVEFSDGTKGDGNVVPDTIKLVTESGIELLVTSDHPFLLATGKLERAINLTTNDLLVDESFQPVAIAEIGPGVYTGGIWNISTTTSMEPGESISDHLINTAGIITGDYYAQLFLVEEALLARPAMGTTEYKKLGTKVGTAGSSLRGSTGVELYNFTPYEHKFSPPPGAAPFLPEWMSEAAPGTLRPLNSSVTLETADYVAWLFRRVYPNVDYLVREYWADNTVNAYAWVEGGQRKVRLLGGLIRHRAIQKEGLALVLAHETGHHYGGAPYHEDSNLSCEGQADYYGAWVVMREVFPGEEYFEWIRPAIDQLWDLFANGLLGPGHEFQQQLFGVSGGCGHPPADCRRDTYKAAMRLDAKPDCASLVEGVRKTKPKAAAYAVSDDCCPGGHTGPMVAGMRLVPDPDGIFEKLGVAPCSQDWCRKHLEQVRQVCKDLNWTAHNGRVYMMGPDGRACYCHCQ